MNNVTLYVAIFTVFAMALATITAWSRRDVAVRSLVIVLWVALIPLGWFALNDLLSRPKMVTIVKLHAPGHCAAILHADIKERVGEYLLLRDVRKKNQEPRFMLAEWDLKFAQRLQHAILMRKAAQSRGMIVIGDHSCQEMKRKEVGAQGGKRAPPPSASGDADDNAGDIMFYPDPVNAPPPKDLTPFYTEPMIQMPNR